MPRNFGNLDDTLIGMPLIPQLYCYYKLLCNFHPNVPNAPRLRNDLSAECHAMYVIACTVIKFTDEIAWNMENTGRTDWQRIRSGIGWETYSKETSALIRPLH